MKILPRSVVSPRLLSVMLVLILGWLGNGAYGQATAHYVPGVEGIKGASLPPPGLYLRDYNVFYFARRLNDSNGERIPGSDLRSNVYAQVPRLVWITDKQFLGGYVGVDGLYPFVGQDVRVNTPGGTFDSDRLGAGDPFVESTLSWHLKQFDFSAGVGEWLPLGISAVPPTTKPGLGYFGTMFTLGGTWYPDAEKTWAVSLLNRYEINCQDRDTKITTGDAYTLEWGISKAVCKEADLGVVGYYQQQVTCDHGFGANGGRDRVAAVGPEVSVVVPPIKSLLTLRYDYEFMAENRAQGHTLVLTLTYRF